MKNFLATSALALLALCALPAFGQSGAKAGEAGAEIEFLKNSETLRSNFVNDISSRELADAVANKITKYEIDRFAAPFGSASVNDIVQRNCRAEVVKTDRGLVGRIYFTHPDPSMASRLANLFATEYVEHQKRLASGERVSELDELDKKIKSAEKSLDSARKIMEEVSERISKGTNVSDDLQEKAATNLANASKRLSELHKAKKKLAKEIKKTSVPARVLK
ncbi:MAG: hypothetical protein J6P03_02715 [Opitutales bacterium]|nr:hypothetical protein [Opitutales bacterium]